MRESVGVWVRATIEEVHQTTLGCPSAKLHIWARSSALHIPSKVARPRIRPQQRTRPDYGERLRLGMILPNRNIVAESDARAILPVIAELRAVERQLHEIGERHDSVGPGAGEKGGGEGRRSRGG